MTRVAVWAYCANNFGDDVFIDALLRRYPSVKFDFFTPDLDNLRVVADDPRVGRLSVTDFLRRPGRYDAFVLIGGSMFQELPGWPAQWARLAAITAAATAGRVPCYAVGTSFGPWRTRAFRLAYRAVLGRFADVTVRDARSSHALRTIHPRLLPDLAFGAATEPPVPGRAAWGISLLDVGPHRGPADPASTYAALISACLRRSDRVILFAFQSGAHADDAGVVADAMARLTPGERERIETVTYAGDLQPVRDGLARCEVMIASRFHAMIFGLLAGCRTVALSYHDKIDATVAAWELPVPVFDLRTLSDRIAAVVAAARTADPLTPARRDELSRAAADHLRALDDCLAP